MTGIIDYGMGNLGSVRKKLERIGEASVITRDHGKLDDCNRLILPGVGSFKKATERLKEYNLWEYLDEAVQVKKIPILGICLGMQLMAKYSEEGNVPGFGWIDAQVVKFKINDTIKYKVPHIGWNHIDIKKSEKIFKEVDLSFGFYFVHSYHLICDDDSDILNMTEYEYPFVSGIQKNNIIGLQYHPEKSHEAGEQLLKNILNYQDA